MLLRMRLTLPNKRWSSSCLIPVWRFQLFVCVYENIMRGNVMISHTKGIDNFSWVVYELNLWILSRYSPFQLELRNRVFRHTITFYILRQNLRQTCFNDFSKCEMVHKTYFSLRSSKQHRPLRPIWISIEPWIQWWSVLWVQFPMEATFY